MKKFLVFVLIIAAIAAAAIFLLPTSEEHNFATEWTFDDENHWHACLDDGCTVKIMRTPTALMMVWRPLPQPRMPRV